MNNMEIDSDEINNIANIFERMRVDASCTEDNSFLIDLSLKDKSLEQLRIQDKTNAKKIIIDNLLYSEDKAFKSFLITLSMIEQFVSKILSSDKPAYQIVEEGNKKTLKLLPLSSFYAKFYKLSIELGSLDRYLSMYVCT